MITMYGTSGYLQLLDDEPAPFESRDELLRKAREERLSRAAEKRNKFKEEFIAKHTVMLHDHRYSTCNDSAKLQPIENANGTITYNELVRDFYANHVCLNLVAIEKLEKDTRCQVSSDLWHQERKLRITASTVKEVYCRRDTTSNKPFVLKKLAPKFIDTAAIHYGMTMNKKPLSLTKHFVRVMGRKWLWNHVVLLLVCLSRGWLPVQMELCLKMIVKDA